MEFPEIHFDKDNIKLHSYNKYFWNPGETRLVEFYPNQITPVTLYYSSDPDLLEKLKQYIDGNPISIDLEWSQPSVKSPHPVELFQFASSKGVVIVASHENKGFDQIGAFLHMTKFFGKGMSGDKKKLHQCCNEDFDIEDIEQTRLTPNNITINFESLTNQFLGPGTAKFKDHKVQRSNWSLRPLTILQVLYGAHDSYAMLLVYHKLVEQFGAEIKIQQQKTTKKAGKSKEKANKKGGFKSKEITVQFIDLDSYLSSHNIQIQMTEEETTTSPQITIKDQVVKNAIKMKMQFQNEDDAFLQNANAILTYRLPRKTEPERQNILKHLSIAADLIYSGAVIYLPRKGEFRCQQCEKFLCNDIALLQHAGTKHIPKNMPELPLDVKDVLLRFLNATQKVVCPIQFTYDPASYENPNNDDDDDEDEEDDDNDLSSIECQTIVPLTYDPKNGIKCNMCNLIFTTVDDLRNHCWINHYEMFLKAVVTSQESYVDPKIMKFESFCVNNLKMAQPDPTKNNVLKCNVCNKNSNVSKFFKHLYFQDPSSYAIVRHNQYSEWPLRYEEFDALLQTQAKYAVSKINYDELEKNNLYSKAQKKCVDCDVTFQKKDEMNQHYLEHHMIYFPSLLIDSNQKGK